MVRFILILFSVIWISFGSAFAQESPNPDQKITPREYDIFIDLPEDYYLAYRVGSFPNYVEEYIRKGENIENWSEMYSIGYLGKRSQEDFSKLEQQINSRLSGVCENTKTLFTKTQNLDSELMFIDYGLICSGTINPSVQVTKETVLRDVEIILSRFIYVQGNVHQVQRAWHGTREDYESFKDIEQQVQIWRDDLDRFSVCRFADIENLCSAIDSEDQSPAGKGKDYAFLVILAENPEGKTPSQFLNKIVYGQDNMDTNRGALNTATNALRAYKAGLQPLIVIQFEALPERDENGIVTNRDYPKARVDFVSFLGLVYELLY